MNSRGRGCFDLVVHTSFVSALLLISLLLLGVAIGCGDGGRRVPAVSMLPPGPPPVPSSVSNISLALSSPSEEAIGASPMHLSGKMQGAAADAGFEIWVDSELVTKVTGTELEVDVPVAAGRHTIAVKAFDSTGGDARKSVNISVPFPRFAYVLNSDGTVSAFAIDFLTGILRATEYAATSNDKLVAIAASGGNRTQRVFANSSTGRLLRFDNNLNETRTLTLVSETRGASWAPPLPAPGLVLSPNGRFLYQSMADSDLIRGFVNDWQSLEMSNSPFQASGSAPMPMIASPLSFTPDGRFAYLAREGSSSVELFRADAQSGDLFSTSLIKAASSSVSTHIDSRGQFLAVAGIGGEVALFAVNSTNGQLKPLAGSPLRLPNRVSLVVSGAFMFSTDATGGNISSYRLSLRPNEVKRTSTLMGQYSVLCADPSGQLLFASQERRLKGGSKSFTLDVLRIDPINGGLERLTTVRARGHGRPVQVVIPTDAQPLRFLPGQLHIALNSAAPIGADSTPTMGMLGTYAIDEERGLFERTRMLQVFPNPQIAALDRTWILQAPDLWGGSYAGDILQGESIHLAGTDPNAFAHTLNDFTYTRGCFFDDCRSSNQIVGFRFNGERVTSIATFSSNGPTSMQADPLGEFLIASDDDANAGTIIRSLWIDPATNIPQQVSSTALSGRARIAAVGPSGRFVYVLSDRIMLRTQSQGMDR